MSFNLLEPINPDEWLPDEEFNKRMDSYAFLPDDEKAAAQQELYNTYLSQRQAEIDGERGEIQQREEARLQKVLQMKQALEDRKKTAQGVLDGMDLPSWTADDEKEIMKIHGANVDTRQPEDNMNKFQTLRMQGENLQGQIFETDNNIAALETSRTPENRAGINNQITVLMRNQQAKIDKLKEINALLDDMKAPAEILRFAIPQQREIAATEQTSDTPTATLTAKQPEPVPNVTEQDNWLDAFAREKIKSKKPLKPSDISKFLPKDAPQWQKDKVQSEKERLAKEFNANLGDVVEHSERMQDRFSSKQKFEASKKFIDQAIAAYEKGDYRTAQSNIGFFGGEIKNEPDTTLLGYAKTALGIGSSSVPDPKAILAFLTAYGYQPDKNKWKDFIK